MRIKIKNAHDLHWRGMSAFSDVPESVKPKDIKIKKKLVKDSDSTIGLTEDARKEPMGIASK